ncbi:MAG: nucleoside deaminase [Bacteroidales bacterium]|nr:nucleoside deaminase [Bacteroidales bacterium]MDD4001522.1 nucleoside deaminase [Bacteroidales bacterium]MDD4529720.1 nucleoside deaminase [Bacteroidales bacterium]MDD4830132.1 nucleoside deaminase [Bacteroidales bacterium]
MKDDAYYMQEAIKEAEIALEIDEVPIGAVIVCRDKIVARAHNLSMRLNDFTAHAEMQAFTSATNALGGKYLNDCTLYVTIEPCIMCAGACYWTQIGKVVYGAKDEKRGSSSTGLNLYHPKTIVEGGVLENECSGLMIEFFKNKRII